jgi:hypothetical protein
MGEVPSTTLRNSVSFHYGFTTAYKLRTSIVMNDELERTSNETIVF